jgi:hypothetical protein
MYMNLTTTFLTMVEMGEIYRISDSKIDLGPGIAPKG